MQVAEGSTVSHTFQEFRAFGIGNTDVFQPYSAGTCHISPCCFIAFGPGKNIAPRAGGPDDGLHPISAGRNLQLSLYAKTHWTSCVILSEIQNVVPSFIFHNIGHNGGQVGGASLQLLQLQTVFIKHRPALFFREYAVACVFFHFLHSHLVYSRYAGVDAGADHRDERNNAHHDEGTPGGFRMLFRRFVAYHPVDAGKNDSSQENDAGHECYPGCPDDSAV